MSSSRKPRGDSKLKVLPEARQDQIIELLKSKTMAEVRAELAQDGLHTSLASLSEFYSWWHLRQQFQEDESTTEALLEELKREIPGLTDQQIDELGQRTFSLLSIRKQDLEGFVQLRSARTKAILEAEKLKLRERAEERHGEKLALEKARFKRETAELFLKWFEDQRAREIATKPGISSADKIERIGQLMFGDDWT